MLKAINAKLLLSIFTALVIIGGLLMHQNHVAEQAAANQAKATAILEEQKREHDEMLRQDEASREAVRKKKAESKANSINGSKTWTTYIP